MHDGKIIPNPQACFFVPRVSTNFDDDEKKKTGGLNGIGAKAVAVMSDYFELETVYYDSEKNIYTYYK